jgi:Ca2+-transporting ATPase
MPSGAAGLRGLDPDEAARRLAAQGPNALPGSAPKTLIAIVGDVLREPMFMMLLVAGGLYLGLGDKAEAGFLLGSVLVIIGITLAQERKTQRALESLREMSAPRALVIRGGQEIRIPGREVVLGDLMVLHEGDRIAADALLLDGHLDVNESLLTGEAAPVIKLPGDERGQLFASTVVTKGVGVAEVHAVAGATAFGRIGQALASTPEPLSALQSASRRLIRTVTIGGLALATAQALLNWLWAGRGWLDSALSGIALSMAILPEEIPVILTLFLALGAWRMARHKVLTRRIPSLEAVGAISVLAVDKTGTLTQNRMQVAELVAGDDVFGAHAAGELPETFHELVEFAMLATPLDPFDPMEKAVHAFGMERLAGTEHVHAEWVPEIEYDLSPDILAMTRVFRGETRTSHLLATKGAPEAVIDLCHLPADQAAELMLKVEAMAQHGLRVLGVARGEWHGEQRPASQHDFDFRLLGFVGFADPPRPEVPAAIAECRDAGVRIIMMTGDHAATARAIARQVGLGEHAEVLTGAEIEALVEAALRERLRKVDLCARLRPEHKLRLVQLLRSEGEVVGMTGDGVNDAPALKAADVGIAMGERGTDVAREAAALVLLDDSFASIVAAIRQGRIIYDNITKATRFVFAVHMPIILLALAPTLLHWPVLLTPVHIVLMELLIDPACSIVFEAEPPAEGLMRRAPRAPGVTPFARANLRYGVLQGLGFAALLLAGCAVLLELGMEGASVRSAEFIALVSGVFLLTLSARSRSRALLAPSRAGNPWLRRMFAGVLLMLVAAFAIPRMRRLLTLAPADLAIVVAAAAMIAATGLWLEGWRLIAGRGRTAA